MIKAQEVIPALGHRFVDGICTVCGEKEDTKPSDPVKETDDPVKDTGDPEKEGILIGDLNDDGRITAKDSMITQRFAIHLVKLDDKHKIAADANGDGRVTAADALQILRYSVHLNAHKRIGNVIKA